LEAWFLSDIHLKNMSERNGEILLRFLHSLMDKNPSEIHLFLLGDIFDLWVSDHPIFVRKFQDLVDADRALLSAGARVTYIEGNHDMHVAPFWQKQLGCEVFVEAQYYELNGLTVRVEHGDLINLEDKAYLRYRSFMRHPWVEPLGHIVPGKFWQDLGDYASKKSRARTQKYSSRNEARLVEMIRTHAHRVFEEKPFDLIVSGHMHVIDDYEFQVGLRKSRSINLGSWYRDVKVLHLTGTNLEWVTLHQESSPP
jgi:UDP-2,3-diacylglucosamine hydrolase